MVFAEEGAMKATMFLLLVVGALALSSGACGADSGSGGSDMLYPSAAFQQYGCTRDPSNDTDHDGYCNGSNFLAYPYAWICPNDGPPASAPCNPRLNIGGPDQEVAYCCPAP
jgi:hypothetical protein